MLGFLNISMASTIQRFLNNAQGQHDSLLARKVFNIGIGLHFVIGIAVILLFSIMYLFLFNGVLNIAPDRIDAAKIIYLCLVVSAFFTIITVPYDALINAHEDMLTYSVIGIIDIFLKLLVAIAVAQASMDKLILYGMLMLAVPVATFAMMKVWCMRKYEECVISVRTYYDKSVSKQILAFSGWSLVGTSSSVVGNYGNNIVMNHFYGVALNAVMGIANQFQGMLMVLSSGMTRALNPVIYKSGAENHVQMIQYSYLGCKYSYLLFALFAFPVIIATPFVLELWLGQIPLWAVLFVRLQLLRCLLEQLTSSLNKALEAVGKIKEYNIAVFAFNILPIGILSIAYSLGLPPYYHYIVAIFFMVLMVAVVKVYYCVRYCGLDLLQYVKVVLLPCLICSVISLSIGFLLSVCFKSGTVSVMLAAVVSFVATIASAFFFMSRVERDAARKLFVKITKILRTR